MALAKRTKEWFDGYKARDSGRYTPNPHARNSQQYRDYADGYDQADEEDREASRNCCDDDE